MKKVYESPVLDIVRMESANNTMLQLSNATAGTATAGTGVYGNKTSVNVLN